MYVVFHVLPFGEWACRPNSLFLSVFSVISVAESQFLGSMSCPANSVHLFGECVDRSNKLFFSVFSVPLWLNCFF
jgi:hypothetical protein